MGTATTHLVLIADHADRAQRRLLRPWQDQPRIAALVRALAEGTQVLEEQAFSTIVSTGIDVATGAALDEWGDLVGEPRGPLNDAEYRTFIQARMLANRCRGTIDELITIFKICTAAISVRYDPNYPAGFVLYARRHYLMPDTVKRRVRRMMDDAKPAGVEMTLIEYLAGYYGFHDDPDAEGMGVGRLARLIE